MPSRYYSLPMLGMLIVSLARADELAKPISAVVESSLATDKGQIRQFAFDGDDKTYFASEKDAGKDDHFTLSFDKAVSIKSIKAVTGKPTGGDALDTGLLEVSADGKAYEKLIEFKDGTAEGKPKGTVKAIRLKVTDDLKHPLAIREITVESESPVATFKYPVEFVLDCSDSPDMKEWLEKVARICEREYTMLNEELKSEGFKPRTVIYMTLKNDYKGVAEAGGGRIKGSVSYFKSHKDDVGAFVHETAHVVQNYRTRNNPGWLVEGIADYVRFFKYEPNKPKPLSPERAKYDGSYRTSAAFLEYLTQKYDKEIVKKLNKAMREGEYSADLFKTYTKKTLAELGEEWKESLKK